MDSSFNDIYGPGYFEIRIFWENYITTMDTDALSPCVARTSATMVLAMQDDRSLVFREEGFRLPWGCFTNFSWALQNILSKFVDCRNCTSYENVKLKLCTCAQSMALGTCTKFEFEILTITVISAIVYFSEIILGELKTNPWTSQS